MTDRELRVISDHRECTLCELHEYAENPGIGTRLYLPSRLPGTAPAVFMIGQNPGQAKEDPAGDPYQGVSGQILRRSYIKGSGLHDLATIYLTNTVRCMTLGNEPPKVGNCNACMPYTKEDLQYILEEHGKAVILCLGAVATKAFWKDVMGEKDFSLKKAFNCNGDAVGDLRIFSTFHPAAVWRENNLIRAVANHMVLLTDCVRGRVLTPTIPRFVPPRYPS